jgi:hypothetical protein
LSTQPPAGPASESRASREFDSLWPLAGGRPAQLGVAVSAALFIGILAASGNSSVALVGVLAAIWMALAGQYLRGSLIGLLLLVVLDGVPFLSTASINEHLLVPVEDLAVFALVVVLLWINLERPPNPARARTRLVAAAWSALFVSAWLLELGRTLVNTDVPLLDAFLIGRDFLYFALLLPLMIGGVVRRADIVGVAAVLGAGAFIFALGQFLIQLGIGATDLIHPAQVSSFAGLPRLYSSMNDLISLLAVLSVGLTVLGESARNRRVGAAGTLVFGTAFLLSFTRASYLGLAGALLLVSIVWSIRESSSAARLRRTMATLNAVATITLGGAFALQPSFFQSGPVGAVSSRVTSVFATQTAATQFDTSQAQTATVALRLDVGDRMLQVLGNDWFFGLGFLHPNDVYEADLPDGTIRNTNLGVFNILMTMGIVGLALLYAPVAVITYRLAASGGTAGIPEWLKYGAAIWLVMTLISSISLVTLFSTSGLILTALLLAVVVAPEPAVP